MKHIKKKKFKWQLHLGVSKDFVMDVLFFHLNGNKYVDLLNRNDV